MPPRSPTSRGSPRRGACACSKGPYFVSQSGHFGQDNGPNVVDFNTAATGQPGLWCQWEPVENGAALAWNGVEKFYATEEWMGYVIDHFLRPGAKAQQSGDSQFAGFTFDHRCDGRVLASGEEFPDLWCIEVTANEVQTSRYEAVDFVDGFNDALYTYQLDPPKALALLEVCVRETALEPELRRFLEDLARVVPAEHRAHLERLLASS